MTMNWARHTTTSSGVFELRLALGVFWVGEEEGDGLAEDDRAGGDVETDGCTVEGCGNDRPSGDRAVDDRLGDVFAVALIDSVCNAIIQVEENGLSW
jgi:hypothetical protein